MSGSPKRAVATIRQAYLAALEEARAERARQEAAIRAEAERASRARRRAGVEARRRDRELGEQRRKERVAAEAAVASLTDRLAGLEADPVCQAWSRDALERLRRIATRWQEAVHNERFADVINGQAQADGILAEALEAAQRKQLLEDKRHYVVSGLLSVLQEEGFMVDDPILTRPGDYGSDVVIHAVRTDGRQLSVAVPTAGDVSYTVDGYARRMASGSATCDEAEGHLEQIHRRLASEFQIDMGELRWDGKDPNRIRKGALDLPFGGGPAVERRA